MDRIAGPTEVRVEWADVPQETTADALALTYLWCVLNEISHSHPTGLQPAVLAVHLQRARGLESDVLNALGTAKAIRPVFKTMWLGEEAYLTPTYHGRSAPDDPSGRPLLILADRRQSGSSIAEVNFVFRRTAARGWEPFAQNSGTMAIVVAHYDMWHSFTPLNAILEPLLQLNQD